LTSSPFGAPSASNPTYSGAATGANWKVFGSPSTTSTSSPASPFSSPQSLKPKPSTNGFASSPTSTFGSSNALKAKANTNGFTSTPPGKSIFSKDKSFPQTNFSSTNGSHDTLNGSGTALGRRIDQALQKEGIIRPAVLEFNPSNSKQDFSGKFLEFQNYRNKARLCLIKAGLIDDPDKPKRLSEAIDFKGTCEEMCPQFEQIYRINETRFDSAEKQLLSNGALSRYPVPSKMVKAMARAAAGQETPLPEDIRTPATLRKTTDYLMHTILGEKDLRSVHSFLWDRTRAVRRDFAFHSSMTASEVSDQIYCLEQITRFHVVSLHQMSKEGAVAEGFVEQQEVEQLGKTLLSLMHAYDDCNAQGKTSENEAEFRAYWVLYNSHDPGILGIVQDWGWKFWGESELIKIAVSLVEALQNIWDQHGPLQPYSPNDIAQNDFSRFFLIVEDKKVSYTMACFAEMHFTKVRKSILTAVLASYRKQRDQTKDWTLTKLNAYLRFDDEADIVPFGEAHGLRFDEFDGEEYLSFEAGDKVSEAVPPVKQRHSYELVERKRGKHTLSEAIKSTIFEEVDSVDHGVDDEDDELFVRDESAPPQKPLALSEDGGEISPTARALDPHPSSDQSSAKGNVPKAGSIFEQVKTQKSFGSGFFTSTPPGSPPSAQSGLTKPGSPSLFPNKQENESPSIFTHPPPKEPPATQSSPFSFLNPTSTTDGNTGSQPSLGMKSSPLFPASQKPLPEPTTSSNQLSGSSAFPTSTFSQQHPTQLAASTVQPPLSFSNTTSTSASFFGPHPSKPISESTQLPSAAGHQAAASASTARPKAPFFIGQSDGTRSLTSKQSSASSTTEPTSVRGQDAFSAGTPQAPFIKPTDIPAKNAMGANNSGPLKPLSGSTLSAPIDRSSRLTGLAKWIALGDGGLLDQFAEFHVDNIVRDTVRMFMQEEANRIAREAETFARNEADQFRQRSLATKYCYRWREAARLLWLKRRGREARKIRREMAESMRASKAAQSANVVEDFRASVKPRKRHSLESLLDASGILNGVHDASTEIKAIVQQDHDDPPSKRQRSERSTNSPMSNMGRHRRGKSDNPLRRSLLSDPSYLSGGSRIHLMSNYAASEENQRHVSGVQTDYFRLKARGISTLPDGTPLANSAAKSILHQKHSFDGIRKPTASQKSNFTSAPRSAPSKSLVRMEDEQSGAIAVEDIQALKEKARAMVDEDKKSRQKRNFVDDEELFERAKRIREQMDEGASWFRKQIDMDTASRSMS
jgi:hypothetical protein